MIKKTVIISFKIHNVSNWLFAGSSHNDVNWFLDIEATVGEDEDDGEDDEEGNDGEFVGVPDLLSQLTIASIRWFYRGRARQQPLLYAFEANGPNLGSRRRLA